jgi:RND family efflux transporter MFP subunit
MALALALALCGCRADAEKSGSADAPAAVQVGPENVVTVARGRIVSGPLISGELRAAREATVRAEVGGSMLQVTVDEGESVRRGAVLGRIEAATLENARRSAETAVKSAQAQLEVAEREAARTEQLVAAGALARRDLEVARSDVTAAEAQLADARSRLVTANKQVGDTVLRAPFDGVVADRMVNTGDVVTNGAELFKIIDPSSMRLEAAVPSEELAQLRVGAAVEFSVRGYGQPFTGRIDRISPQADAATRQVPIFVSIPNSGGRLVAGLFAEGRVVTAAAEGLVVPLNAVNTSQGDPWVLRAAGGTTEKVPVKLGLRDDRTEKVQILAGVTEGDALLRGAAQGIAPGTRVAVSGTR